MSNKVLHGIINGKTIELRDDPGVPTGQEVEVVVTAVPPEQASWGQGLKRCAGALANAWSEEDDRILDDNYQERQRPC